MPREVVLVIDHNDALLDRARLELPPVLDGLPAPRPELCVLPSARTRGLSGARNTGVAAARGEVVAFLDDDAVPTPDWTLRLLTAYDGQEVLAVGGVAVPVWPAGGRPRHLVGELDWVVGCSYRGLPTRRSDVRNVLGAGMSFRSSALVVAGHFDERAGRLEETPLGCEETELCIRLQQRVPAGRVVLEPAAVVHHLVSPERTTWGYLVRRAWSEGLSKASIARSVGTRSATSTERAYVRRVLPLAVRRELAAGVRGDRSGLTGAAGIAVSLSATVAGYLRGRARVRGPRDRAGRAPAPTAPEAA